MLVGLGLTITEAAKVLGLAREAVSRTGTTPT